MRVVSGIKGICEMAVKIREVARQTRLVVARRELLPEITKRAAITSTGEHMANI
jgi:hypothetical protein